MPLNISIDVDGTILDANENLLPHARELQWSLEILHCPYTFAAAHVDASPWTTNTPTYLARTPHLLDSYNELLDDGVQNWLPRILGFCQDTVKLVIICPTSDTPGHVEAARLQIIKQKITHLLGQEWNGEIVIKPKSHIPRWAWENRKRLIRPSRFGKCFSMIQFETRTGGAN